MRAATVAKHPQRALDKGLRAANGCGSLSWCSCCRCFGLEYGSLYLNLSETDFVRLLCTVESAAAADPAPPDPDKLYIRLTDEGFLMVIPRTEVGELSGLLLQGYRWLDGRYENDPPLLSQAVH